MIGIEADENMNKIKVEELRRVERLARNAADYATVKEVKQAKKNIQALAAVRCHT